MRKLIFTIGFLICVVSINAQIITNNMTWAQVKTALNNNAANPVLPLSTVSTTGVTFKGTLPWIHDYPGTFAGGGYRTAEFANTRGKNLFIGKRSGNFNISQSVGEGVQNVGVGDSTLSILSTGSLNACFGNSAGAWVTTGNANTLIGRQAGFRITSGNQNTAVGESSLERNKTGYYNTALGANSMMFSIGGINNTMLGWNTGYGQSVGGLLVEGTSNYSGCIGVGNGAFNNAITGQYNIAIGASALGESSTTGANNIAIGIQALNFNHKSYNIAIGDYAGETDSLGYFNTYIGSKVARSTMGAIRNFIGGFNAGMALTSGSENSILGAYAGDLLTSGSSNTLIGRSSGIALTTANGNVFLGYASGYYETGANKLFIDNVTRASEADARIKALIYGVFAAAPADQVVSINAVFRLTPQASAPTSNLAEGNIYCGTDHHIYYYNGTSWVRLDN